ncbi:MAG: hypothetical protein HQ559_14430, partial [Lentisphaerae bacterium]|nr:hypothetical protein [Lentisphaerota bacterium]
MPSIFPHLLDPTVYPDFPRRSVRVPTWGTFENTTQFLSVRAFSVENGRLVRFREDLDLYEKEFDLGRVIWPVYYTIYPENFGELVAEIKKRGLYLFDIWGYIPGETLESVWPHSSPPPGMSEYLEDELGERFLGWDNGEQDGRYIGRYAHQQCPAIQDRFAQYLNFQRHFERLCDEHFNRMTALVSLCFGHYFLKEGNHKLLGAETGQALPSSQLYYSFIRGACKQYGVLWFGNASGFNRWGWKLYEDEDTSGQRRFGPTHGTSLSLLRRLLYSHILYDSVAVGFEQHWVEED